MDELIGNCCAPARNSPNSSETATPFLARQRGCRSRARTPCKAATGRGIGSQWRDHAPGFRDACSMRNGWPALRSKAGVGGQNARRCSARPSSWAASNLAFKLCPMLTQGAIEAIQHFSRHLETRCTAEDGEGEWTRTMNLTEPRAGSESRAGAHALRPPVLTTGSTGRRSSSPTASTT